MVEQAIKRRGRVRRPRPVTRTGVVITDARDKTIKIHYTYQVRAWKYGKYLRRRTTLHAHDERNEARVGDRVEVACCRPISKTKSWRLVRIVHSAAREAAPAGA
jgi:small subunit ribosomal protein S17